MTKTQLEALFEKISKERPSKQSFASFDDYADRNEAIDFLLAKFKEFLELTKREEEWDPDFEWGVIHGVHVIARWKPKRAIEPMLELMDPIADDITGALHDAIMLALEGAGEPALEPLWRRYQRDYEDPEATSTWMWALSNLGVKDDRIIGALLEHVDVDFNEAVQLMSDYGDKALLPLIEGYVKGLAHYLNINKIDPFIYGASLNDPLIGAYINSREALLILREDTTAADPQYGEKVEAFDRQMLQYATYEKHKGDIDRAIQEVMGRRPRPDDPCPCGSGRKYKHCCGAN